MTKTELRKSYGLTLNDVAEINNISHQAVQRYEKGIMKSKKLDEIYTVEYMKKMWQKVYTVSEEMAIYLCLTEEELKED